MNEATERRYFPFYASFRECLSHLPDDDRLQCLDAILDYAFERKEPERGGIIKSIFPLIKPVLDRDWKQYENGCKGGRPSR